jgi:hypothetical protein
MPKKMQTAAEGSIKDDAICPTSSGTHGGSAPKKSRATARCFTASENKELESLLTTGNLTSLPSRQAEATRMSTKSGNNLSLQQLSDWMSRRNKASRKES